MTPSSRGFTLIEVMIVVAVVAILSAIAYPSYQEHVRRSHRSAAQAFMLDVAARQQQRLIDMRSYAPDLATLFASVGEPSPDGTDPERAKAFAAVMDGHRLREDLAFQPLYPRLADAVRAGQV